MNSDERWAREALLELLKRISRNLANDRLIAALDAAAEARARARRRS